MKPKYKYLALVFSMVLTPFLSFSTIYETSCREVYDPLHYKDIPPDRKRMPSQDRIMFSYNSEIKYCDFVLNSEIRNLSVTIHSVCEYYNFDICSNNPIWEVELKKGEYTITCIADDGTIYEGFVVID